MSRIAAVTMPKWGMTMTEGRVAAWLKAEGDAVEPGEDLVEIETEKITNVVEAAEGGTLRRILVAPGQTAPCGAPIALIAGADATGAELDAVAAGGAVAAAGTAAAERRLVTGADGIGLSVVTANGGAAGVPVVLIHGFASDAAVWMFNEDALAAGRPVHAVDLPSHGASGVRAEATGIDALAAAVRDVAEALVRGGPLHLVGHSLGGRIALRLARGMGGRVRSLTLIAPAGLGSGVNAGFVQGYLAADRRRAMRDALRMLVADEASVTAEMVENALAAKRIDGVGEALAAIAAQTLSPEAAASGLDDLAAMACPVLILWGAEDRVVPPAAGVGATRIESAGHLPQMEQAARVNALILAHVGGAE